MAPTRRAVLAALALGIAGLAARAGRAADRPPIGFLAAAGAAAMAPFAGAFRRGLASHGYVEGESIEIEWRWRDGEDEAADDAAAAALARMPLRLVVAATLGDAQAIRRANDAMPIVMVAGGDPVGLKLAHSLARPGGMVTGLTDYRVGFAERRLKLLKEAAPLISRVAFLRNQAAPTAQQTEAAAAALKLAILPIELGHPADLEPALAQLATTKGEALLVAPNLLSFTNRARIAAAANQRRLPTLYGYSDFMDVDGLMAFGADLEQHYVQAARYVRDILHGAKPGDLPIRGPSGVELVISLRNARALGLTLPPSLLATADRLVN